MKARLGLAAVILFFLLVAVILFSRAVSIPISHDEYQFVASAQFFRQGLLLPYVDYPFLHMPYMPIINSLAILFTRYDLFAIRLLNSFFTLLSMLLLFDLIFRQSSGAKNWQRVLFGATGVLLYLTNPSFIEIDGRALNHTLPILLSLVTFWLVTRPLTQGAPWVFLLCGLLVGLAAGLRLSYIVLAVPILFAIFFDPLAAARKQRIRRAISLSAGVVLALIPAGVLLLMAPRQFIYGNFHYAVLNAIYRQNLGSSENMTLLGKAAMLFQFVFSDPATSILYILAFLFFSVVFIRWIRKKKDADSFQMLVLFAYSAVLLAAGFAPTPSWPQYFVALTPFLILGLFWGLGILRRSRPIFAWAAVACLGMALIASRPLREIAPQLGVITRQEAWIPMQMHRLAEEIQAKAGCMGTDCKLLTLAPIYPLEAGMNTYAMFTVGSFSWRTAPILPAETRAAYHIISYEELEPFLSADPPRAILTGTEAEYDGFTTENPGKLDQSFIDYAARNRYRPVQINGLLNNQTVRLTVWVK